MSIEAIKKSRDDFSKQLQNAYKIHDPNVNLWMDVRQYMADVDFLLKELEKSQQQSKEWELQFYRQIHKGIFE